MAGIYGRKLTEFKRTGEYDLAARPVSAMPVYSGGGKTGIKVTSAALPMPDTSGILKTGAVVSVTPDNYARSFVEPIYSGGRVIREAGQALFAHPQTGKWVPFAQLPVGPDGLRQSLGQQDGNPYVNRTGQIEVARPKEPSRWMEFREDTLKPTAMVASIPLAAAAFAPAAASAAGTASTAAEAASAAGVGASSAAPAVTGAQVAAPTLTGAKVAGTSSGLSGLMSWLGSPTGQAVSQLGSSALQGITAQRAAGQQAAAAQGGIEEQRRQFEAMRAGLAPFQQAGTQALGGFAPYQQAGLQAFGQQQALAGLQGQQAQQQAIGALEASPLYQSLAKQGEEAILQRASATGGLRGGNVQAALAQFRPAMLQQLIDQQYQRLGGFAGTGLDVTNKLASLGQSSAAMQGQSGMNAATNIGNLLAQQGQAQAGGTLGIGQGIGQALNIPQQMAGQQRANRLFDMTEQLYKRQMGIQ